MPVKKKKTKTKPKAVRGERLVAHILDVALYELEHTGFAGFSIEAVAERAGVNKTTIYRRWPTREDLALAALECNTVMRFDFQEEGNLVADLTTFLKKAREAFTMPQIEWLLRLWFSTNTPVEYRRIVGVLRDDQMRVGHAVLKHAVERRELPASTDVAKVFDLMIGAWIHLVFRLHKTDDATLYELRDFVLRGAGATPSIATTSARR